MSAGRVVSARCQVVLKVAVITIQSIVRYPPRLLQRARETQGSSLGTGGRSAHLSLKVRKGGLRVKGLRGPFRLRMIVGVMERDTPESSYAASDQLS